MLVQHLASAIADSIEEVVTSGKRKKEAKCIGVDVTVRYGKRIAKRGPMRPRRRSRVTGCAFGSFSNLILFPRSFALVFRLN